MQHKPELGYVYPEKTDEHMIDVPHVVDTNFDENYDYVDKSFWFRFKRFWLFVLLHTIVLPVTRIRFNLKIVGRKKLKKHKEILKNGVVTTCNHVFMWDYLCVLAAISPRKPYVITWETNFEGPNRKLIRLIGGVPIPTKNLRGMAKFSQTIDGVLKSKKWVHVYPEGSMWHYYSEIRPFKKGAFKYAHQNNVPVLPLAISYRDPKGLHKLFGKKKPMITLTIGDPLMADKSLPKNEAVEKLCKKCHETTKALSNQNL